MTRCGRDVPAHIASAYHRRSRKGAEEASWPHPKQAGLGQGGGARPQVREPGSLWGPQHQAGLSLLAPRSPAHLHSPDPPPAPHGPEAKAQVLCLRPVGPGCTSSTMGRGAKSIRTQMHVGQGGAASPAPRLSSTMLPCFPHKATVWKAGVEQGEVVCGATAGARQGQELAGTFPVQGHSLTASVLSV